jgi:hypothetical protein
MVISEQSTPVSGTPAPATTTPAPATTTPAPAAGTPAPAATVTVPDLIKQIQTILNTKYGAKLNVDGKWGNLTQTALETAVKSLQTPATTPPPATAPTTGTTAPAPVATNAFSATNPANKIPDFKGFTPSTPTLK